MLGRFRFRLLHEATGLSLRLGLGFRQTGLSRPLSLRHHALGLRLSFRLTGLVGLLGFRYLLDRFQRHAFTAFPHLSVPQE